MRVFVGLVVQPFVAAGLAFVSSPLMEWSGPRNLRKFSERV
jgi:hypothetical protein